jgi:ABC-type sulfate transport system permease subunit
VGLRGAALLYLGLHPAPVAAILQAGFSDGLTNLRDALDSFGAKGAIELTLIMATITAIVNGVFGTSWPTCSSGFPSRPKRRLDDRRPAVRSADARRRCHARGSVWPHPS